MKKDEKDEAVSAYLGVPSLDLARIQFDIKL